jgi:hypothetical protein
MGARFPLRPSKDKLIFELAEGEMEMGRNPREADVAFTLPNDAVVDELFDALYDLPSMGA